MNFRILLSAGTMACIAACMTTLLAQNRDQEDLASEPRTLRHAYRDARLKLVDIEHEYCRVGKKSSEAVFEAKVALADAEATIAASPAERISALQSSVASLRELEASLEQRLKHGVGGAVAIAQCTAARIHVEIRVLEERERQGTDARRGTRQENVVGEGGCRAARRARAHEARDSHLI